MGVQFSDLGAAIQREIRQFDVQYRKALDDGFVDDTEFRLLTTKSGEIAKQIEIEHSDNDDKSDGTGTAVAVVLVGILAAFGLGKLASK